MALHWRHAARGLWAGVGGRLMHNLSTKPAHNLAGVSGVGMPILMRL